MDRKHIGMTIAVTFLLVIITMTVKTQISAIENSADISQDAVADTTRAAATVLHIRSSSQSQEFGKIGRSELDDLMYDCGSNSGLAALSGDVRAAQESNLEVCTPSNQVGRWWSENGLLTGIVVVEEDNTEHPEWTAVAVRGD